MKYCTHCGKECLDDAVICTACGCSVQYNAPSAREQKTPIPIADKHSTLSVLGFVFAFFSTLVGLILSIVAYREAKETGSKKSQNLATAGIIISAACTVLAIMAGILISFIFIGLMFESCNTPIYEIPPVYAF